MVSLVQHRMPWAQLLTHKPSPPITGQPFAEWERPQCCATASETDNRLGRKVRKDMMLQQHTQTRVQEPLVCRPANAKIYLSCKASGNEAIGDRVIKASNNGNADGPAALPSSLQADECRFLTVRPEGIKTAATSSISKRVLTSPRGASRGRSVKFCCQVQAEGAPFRRLTLTEAAADPAVCAGT